MKTIKVNKFDLLTKLRENLEKHVSDYSKAIKKYYDDLADALLETSREETPDLSKLWQEFNDKPRSYENEYKKTIEMVEWSVDDLLELDQTEFSCYILDNWTWKASFTTSNAKYGV
jgi:methionine synthase II (cobalamin-independent)